MADMGSSMTCYRKIHSRTSDMESSRTCCMESSKIRSQKNSMTWCSMTCCMENSRTCYRKSGMESSMRRRRNNNYWTDNDWMVYYNA